MEFTLEQILKSLADRCAADRWGIGTALQYVKSIGACLQAGGVSPATAFALADAELWAKELASAAERLTYSDPVMADPATIVKSLRDGTDLTPGAILEFDAVVTSSRKDRDGDILEASGMRVDKNMPLLWQHIQLQPIGKHLQVLDQNNDRVLSKFAIADTELGRDAATLAKFGALRMSQGFRPTKFEPIEIVKNSRGEDVARGWHIKEGEILEASLVSIPANSDAVITAFSQGKLHTPLVKSWAKQAFDARPVQIPVNIELKLNGQPLTVKGSEPAAPTTSEDREVTPPPASDPPADSVAPDTKQLEADDVAAITPAVTSLLAKMLWGAMDDELTGSFEWVQSKLQATAEKYLALHGKSTDRGYVRLIATYADYGILNLRSWESNDSVCYRAAWALGEDGVPAWNGDPVDVEVTAVVREKFLAPLEAKEVETDSLPLVELQKQFGRAVAALEPDAALAALQPFAGLHEMYANAKKQREWGDFASSLQ